MVPMNIKKDWKAKLESAYSFMLKYSEITVCLGMGFAQAVSTSAYKSQHECRRLNAECY